MLRFLTWKFVILWDLLCWTQFIPTSNDWRSHDRASITVEEERGGWTRPERRPKFHSGFAHLPAGALSVYGSLRRRGRASHGLENMRVNKDGSVRCIHTADKLRKRSRQTKEMCVFRDLDVITEKSAGPRLVRGPGSKSHGHRGRKWGLRVRALSFGCCFRSTCCQTRSTHHKVVNLRQ